MLALSAVAKVSFHPLMNDRGPYRFVLTLPGRPALSAFRVERVRRSLQEHAPHVESLGVKFVHFVLVSRQLDEKEHTTLRALLDCTPEPTECAHSGVSEFLVTPRPGTISPWSSKATDIAHNCGLSYVQRIERGTCWQIGLKKILL